MNHVTFKTAKALKESGFPQPKPEIGQVWLWKEDGEPIIIIPPYNLPEGTFRGDCEGIWSEEDFKEVLPERVYFAPTATDILKEFGEEYTLVSKPTGFFVIYNAGPYRSFAAKNENAAEGAAKCWLIKASSTSERVTETLLKNK